MTPDFPTFADDLNDTARRTPDHIVIVDGERTFTYAVFASLVERAAAAMARDGVAPRDVVVIAASTSAEYLVVFYAALRLGVTAAPLPTSTRPADLAAMIADSGASKLFVDASGLEATALVGAEVARIDLAPAAFATWLAPAGAQAPKVAVQPDWVFNLIYSSGTTGIPKGIAQSHAMRRVHVQRAKVFMYGPDSRTLISTPLYSNTTLVSVFPAVVQGGTIVLMRKFDARGFLELAQKHRITQAMLVPVQYRRILEHPDFDSFDLTSFRLKYSTSAPFSANLKREILRRWPGGLIELYGLTEGGGTFLLFAHEHPDKLHTVGKIAEGHEARIIDEDGRELPPGSIGEIAGRSAAMMIGYRNRPEATKAMEWFDAEGRRFLRTGDVGRLDEDGFLTLLDRAKDMIISGGFNVYPSDLEAAIVMQSDVAEAAVVGAASKRWGETPVAFVVLKAGAAADGEAIRQAANAQLGKTQRIAKVELVDVLPRNAIGKVMKRELRERAGTVD